MDRKSDVTRPSAFFFFCDSCTIRLDLNWSRRYTPSQTSPRCRLSPRVTVRSRFRRRFGDWRSSHSATSEWDREAPDNRLPLWGHSKENRPQGCRRSSSWRRKEVALGRLSTLTVILILGTWGAATEGAPPDDAVASPSAAARKPAPVPPIKYLEAGARLFNSGNFELAAKYLDAAQIVSGPAPGRTSRPRSMPT